MFRGIVAILLIGSIFTQDEEPFKLPMLKGTAFFADPFANTDGIGSIWGLSSSSGDKAFDGRWEIEGSTVNPEDLGLVIKDKAKHHAISAKLNSKIDFTDLHASQKPLVVQYEVKYQDSMECGGSYLKLVAESEKEFTSEDFSDKSMYSIMFGPDKCGLDSKIHLILNYRDPVTNNVEEKHAKASDNFKEMFSDGKSHLITLVLDYDGSFEIFVDQNSVNSGNILEDMSPAINPPSEIDDPSEVKPSDWDDKEKIPDPMATKPEDWDEDAPKFITDSTATMPEDWLEDEPEYVADPEAVKPEEWDDEDDGEWEAPQIANPKCEAGNCGPWEPPQIPNPEFKGRWAPPLIDNPNYSGVWAPKKIPNPNFFEDKTPFASLLPIVAVGIEVWTMTKDIMFDNVILTDSKATADEWAAESWNMKTLKEKLAAGSDGVIDQVMSFANDNPIMYAVFALVAILPIFLIYYLCCRGGSTHSTEDVGEAKKTDKVTPDDEEEEDIPGLEEDEKEPVVDEEPTAEPAAEKEPAAEPAAEKEPVTEEVQETEKEDAPVKRRTRKAD